MSEKYASNYNIQSVDLAFDVLELMLLSGESNITIPFISKRLEISRNKVFRTMSTLERRGLVECEKGSGNYRVGLNAVSLSQRILQTTNIIKHAHPVMENLAKKHDEAVYMTVLDGNEVMFLDMVDCEQNVKAAPVLGRRFPFFNNAAGKVIKALQTNEIEKVEKAIRKSKKIKMISDMASLGVEFDDIRLKGVAIESGGLGDGIISVAVAVKDYAGKIVGAITMLGPSVRMLSDRLENEIIPSLLEGADILSEKFGYAKG